MSAPIPNQTAFIFPASLLNSPVWKDGDSPAKLNMTRKVNRR